MATVNAVKSLLWQPRGLDLPSVGERQRRESIYKVS